MAFSYTCIPVLQFLTGQPWDDVAKAFAHSLRPSSVRTTEGEVKTDARCWRVTVHLRDGLITNIEQEVEVLLPDGVQHGHDLVGVLRKRGVAL